MTLVGSTLDASPFSPAIAADGDLFFPSGVSKKYVDANLINTQVLERTDRSDQSPAVYPAQAGQTAWRDRSDRSFREDRENLKPQAQEGPV